MTEVASRLLDALDESARWQKVAAGYRQDLSRLRSAVDALERLVSQAGASTNRRHEEMRNLRIEWPELVAEIAAVVKVRKEGPSAT